MAGKGTGGAMTLANSGVTTAGPTSRAAVGGVVEFDRLLGPDEQETTDVIITKSPNTIRQRPRISPL
ncbi:MAG: hypothetical protein NVSMB60_14060 [Mycobacterium sp.]